MPTCAIKVCRNYKNRLRTDHVVTYHRIPSDPVLRNKWINIIKRSRKDELWKPPKDTIICSDHFKKKDLYFVNKEGRRRLKRDAVPCKALFLSSVQSDSESSDEEVVEEKKRRPSSDVLFIACDENKSVKSEISDEEGETNEERSPSNEKSTVTAKPTPINSRRVPIMSRKVIPCQNCNDAEDLSEEASYLDCPRTEKLRGILDRKIRIQKKHFERIRSLKRKNIRLNRKVASLKQQNMEKLPPKQKKLKGATREELLNIDKDELVNKIIQLEAHNAQLKNIISKNLGSDSVAEKNERKKPFDFTKCHYRRVFLHILYFGWDYQGLAVQEDTTQTIEHQLFNALTKSCLIASRETSQYHRCGRTDKGVSAAGQVISITLRSKNPPELQNDDEMPYCKILNRLLPKEIRAVAWMPIPGDILEYSARFDCKKRQYKYYFPRSNLNLTAMMEACSHLIGSHDFRHLCKMDVGNGVVEFTREILRAEILPVGEAGEEPTTMYYLLIEGNAFLWHQIRCIMGVLLLVGQGKESPDVVLELLDVRKNPRKPQYNMALDVPLNLFHCTYDLEDKQNWIYDRDELRCVIAHLQSQWTLHSVKTTMIKDTLQHLENEYAKITTKKETEDTDSNGKEEDVITYTDCLLQGVKPRVYTPLLKRETCSTTMYYLLIEGNAFLWHQIRCIMGVLLLVGQGKESPDVVLELLDVRKNPRKPQYNMALDVPLNLFHCTYDLEDKQNWIYDRDELRCVIAHLQSQWTLHSVKTTMIKDTLQHLENEYAKITTKKETEDTDSNGKEEDVITYTDCLLQGVKPRVYTPLLKRETCSSLEERIEYYRKKRKTDDNENCEPMEG